MSVPDTNALADVLEKLDLSRWSESLQALARERMSPAAHGDYARWQGIVDRLYGRFVKIVADAVDLDVTLDGSTVDPLSYRVANDHAVDMVMRHP